jgi:hypothetical protein
MEGAIEAVDALQDLNVKVRLDVIDDQWTVSVHDDTAATMMRFVSTDWTEERRS